ncbi:response regulator [Patescibacteria group bacterium]|nr:response regulator [Patescibacteria group bacterium]
MIKVKSIKILVVEDEIPLQNVIRLKLEKNNFSVVTASTVDEALNKLKDTEIKVIWLDHYLVGGQNGICLVSKLMSEKRGKEMSIFVVSNTASNDNLQSYIDLGVKQYFTKSRAKLSCIVDTIKSNLQLA